MTSTRRALAYSFLDRYAALALAIGSSMLVARLLTPTEIGVFSVTMVLLSFTASLRDFGAGQYLLQEKDLTTDRIRATWAVQSGTGLLFCILVLIASLPVARFYGDPRMAHHVGGVAELCHQPLWLSDLRLVDARNAL
jgi:O-antigen/teichoic acid export membrane protein